MLAGVLLVTGGFFLQKTYWDALQEFTLRGKLVTR